MEDVELLMTDEFEVFSMAVKFVREQKKMAQEDFKVIYDKFKAEMAEMDKKVAEAQETWETFKSGRVKAQAQAQAKPKAKPEVKPEKKK